MNEAKRAPLAGQPEPYDKIGIKNGSNFFLVGFGFDFWAPTKQELKHEKSILGRRGALGHSAPSGNICIMHYWLEQLALTCWDSKGSQTTRKLTMVK